MRGLCAAGWSTMRRVNSRMITTMTTSPANTQRQEKNVVTNPPISGPAATAMAPAAAISPYTAERRELGKFAATSATIAGMISAAPRPSSTDQPMSRTVSVGDIAVVSDPTP
jgi:hypothetical protein